jgi:hypothetical protein
MRLRRLLYKIAHRGTARGINLRAQGAGEIQAQDAICRIFACAVLVLAEPSAAVLRISLRATGKPAPICGTSPQRERAWSALGPPPVYGAAGRAATIALDDPGASRAGSGDWAFASDIGSAAMLPASIKDVISVRKHGVVSFLTPYENACIGRFVTPQR